MIKPIAKQDIFADGNFFSKGDEVNASYGTIVRLNEKGLIEPLSYKELLELKEEKENANNTNKD